MITARIVQIVYIRQLDNETLTLTELTLAPPGRSGTLSSSSMREKVWKGPYQVQGAMARHLNWHEDSAPCHMQKSQWIS